MNTSQIRAKLWYEGHTVTVLEMDLGAGFLAVLDYDNPDHQVEGTMNANGATPSEAVQALYKTYRRIEHPSLLRRLVGWLRS